MGKMASRIPVQNRAQALSLPIPSTTLILGAAKLAHGVASRVGQAIGFEDVLHGGVDSVGSVAGLTDQLADSIREHLNRSGLRPMVGGGPNQALQLSVKPDGTLIVEGDHPRAAEIEALLASSPSIVETATRLAQQGGPTQITIDLTSLSVQANIPIRPGMPESFGG